MNVTIAIFIGLSLAVIFLFFYMFARDKEVDRKFQLISAALENINQEIYKLQKQQKDNSLQNIETLISEQLNDVLDNLLLSIKQSQNHSQREIELLFDKISQIELNVKSLSLPNVSTITNKKDDSDKVKALYDIGYSIEEIAKDTGISAGEIKLMLNLMK